MKEPLVSFKRVSKSMFAEKNNQFDTHYQNCSSSRYFSTNIQLFRTVPNDLVQISYFCIPAVLVRASQLNLFPRFCILGELDIFGNIGFFDCFKPNCEFVFLFDGCL